jgi:hypothetical protein
MPHFRGHFMRYCGYSVCRQTPFASGPNDTPSEILHRIAESKLDLRSGTWVTISNEAKVGARNVKEFIRIC